MALWNRTGRRVDAVNLDVIPVTFRIGYGKSAFNKSKLLTRTWRYWMTEKGLVTGTEAGTRFRIDLNHNFPSISGVSKCVKQSCRKLETECSLRNDTSSSFILHLSGEYEIEKQSAFYRNLIEEFLFEIGTSPDVPSTEFKEGIVAMSYRPEFELLKSLVEDVYGNLSNDAMLKTLSNRIGEVRPFIRMCFMVTEVNESIKFLSGLMENAKVNITNELVELQSVIEKRDVTLEELEEVKGKVKGLKVLVFEGDHRVVGLRMFGLIRALFVLVVNKLSWYFRLFEF
jgi:hypothetical protein